MNLNEFESLINKKKSDIETLIKFKKKLFPDNNIYTNFKFTYNIGLEPFIDKYLIITEFPIQSNCLSEYYITYNGDKKKFINLFYVPDGLSFEFYQKTSEFINMNINTEEKKIFKITGAKNSPRVKLDFFNHLNDISIYMGLKFFEYFYLNQYMETKNYIEDSKIELVSKSEKNQKLDNIGIDPDIFDKINKKNITQKEFKENFDQKGIIQTNIRFPNLDHIILRIMDGSREKLETYCNIPYPFTRVFFSEDNNTIFMEIAIVGHLKTNLNLLSRIKNLQYYFIIHRKSLNIFPTISKLLKNECNGFLIEKL
ncbi:MAG: hypothetical protein GF329_01265 [Candidatus Lokiarchaeota archaeon]|nr:hypothetical protein [Candidatus Lokiarchaeota archaeon]